MFAEVVDMSAESGVHRPRFLPWIALGTVYLVWGSTYLGIRAAVETIPPMLMAGVRYLIAGLLLYALVARRLGRSGERVTRAHILPAFVVGGLLLVGGNGLLSVGEQHLDSGVAALVVATVPVWMVVIDALTGRLRIRGPLVLGLLFGTAGVALLVGGPGSGRLDLAAVILVLVASIFWAVGSIYSHTAALPAHPVLATAVEMLAGGFLLVLAGIARGELGDLDLGAISGRSIIGLLWLIGPGAMLALSAYTYALRTLPTDTVATYAYVNPVVAVALGAALGQEPVTANLILGGAAIVISVVAILRGRSRSAAPPDPATAAAELPAVSVAGGDPPPAPPASH
jgi:drug/metabolite transporter (DMT)-like permease